MAKQQKIKIPKHIAGVKLKKRTRRALGSLLTLLDTPEARTLIGSASGALLGALSSKRKQADHADRH